MCFFDHQQALLACSLQAEKDLQHQPSAAASRSTREYVVLPKVPTCSVFWRGVRETGWILWSFRSSAEYRVEGASVSQTMARTWQVLLVSISITRSDSFNFDSFAPRNGTDSNVAMLVVIPFKLVTTTRRYNLVLCYCNQVKNILY